MATEIKPRKSLEPWIKDSVVYYPHQIEGIRDLYQRRHNFILGDDMGLGKSLQAMTIFAMIVKTKGISKGIVICPPSLKGNWSDEFDKFSGFDHIIVTGTPKQREKQILAYRDEMKGPRFLIVNYEQVVSHLDLLNTIGLDVAILDEAHLIKGYKSKRTKAIHSLRVANSFLLTGTPMLNRVNELWPLLHQCNPRQFPSNYKFTQRFCVFGGYGGHEIVGIKNETELRSILNKYMLRRMKDNVLDLPPLQVIERRVDLLPEQLKLYKEADEELRVILNGEVKDIENPLVKATRLKQICATTLDFTGEDHSAKLDVALEDTKQIVESGHKQVVFTQFRSVITAYGARMRGEKIPVYELTGSTPIDQRREVVRLWEEDPQPGVLLCMIQIAGVGLNMTAANHCAFIDKLFVPGLNQQGVDRLRRIGAKGESIQVTEYICRKTYENRINHILAFKTELNDQVIGDGDDTDFKKKIIAAMREEAEV
jgi:SNF2 family DNA or RNA helicase